MERPVDENFIRLMETKLTSGRRKGRVGWDNNWHCKWPTNDPMSALFKGLLNEVIELRLAMENKTAVDIGYEAADIANYAMFIADYAGSLEPPKETEGNPLIEMHLSVDPGMADSIEETE